MEPQCLRRISLVALALAWVGVAWAWAEPPKSGGTLRMAFEADITGLDPAIGTTPLNRGEWLIA
jgi:hypothetical protein